MHTHIILFTLTLTPGKYLESSVDLQIHVSGLWEKTGFLERKSMEDGKIKTKTENMRDLSQNASSSHDITDSKIEIGQKDSCDNLSKNLVPA